MQVVDRPIPGRAGAFYTVFVSDLTQNKYGTLTGLTGTPRRHAGDDKTAEIITEAPGGGPSGYNNNPSHTALLNTCSVYYTYGQVVTSGSPRGRLRHLASARVEHRCDEAQLHREDRVLLVAAPLLLGGSLPAR